MNIQLSDHFTYSRLMRFVFPSVMMMIFTSVYGVVDGLFISNYVGKTPFAAVNLIMPFLMLLGGVGFMIGTGGSALVAKTLGEGEKEKANEYFSLLIWFSLGLGILLAIPGILFIEPISVLLGADAAMLEYCRIYGIILLAAVPAFMLQNVFQSFLIAAEKPMLGFVITVAAGVANMVLDALLIAVIPMGVVGAALATAISQCVGGLIPFFYFMRKNDSLLRMTKTHFIPEVITKTCSNGLSELVSNISRSVVSMLYNLQLMRLVGESGVAAFGVIMYVNFIFISIFLGYAIGTAPIFSYHYGAQNHDELKNIFKKSNILNLAAAVVLFAAALLLAAPLSHIFVGYDAELYAMTVRGFRLYAISYLFCGFSLFGSAFFTALNDGLVSAIISFLRTLVFEVLSVLLLPMVLGLDGVWCSISVAEGAALLVTLYFFAAKRKKYHYL